MVEKQNRFGEEAASGGAEINSNTNVTNLTDFVNNTDLLQAVLSRCDRGDCPALKWPDGNGDFWPLNPLRCDEHSGSFSVGSRGYVDFATGEKGGLTELARKLGISQNGKTGTLPDHVYWYLTADGRELLRVNRIDARNGQQKKIWRAPKGVKGPYPLYRLHELLTDTRPVLIVEGEKCVEIAQENLPKYFFTTWLGGAESVDKSDFSPLRDRTVYLWPDADPGGIKAMNTIAEKINKQNCEIRIINIPSDVPEGWDITDALAEAGESVDSVRRMIEAARPYRDEKRGFHFTRVSEVPIKSTDWLIENFFESFSESVIFGDSDTYKTFLSVDIGCCVAAGISWNGNSVKQGAVFFIIGEGRNQFNKRVAAWAIKNQISLNAIPVYISSAPVEMIISESIGEVLSAIDTLRQTAGNPALIVIDTLARNFGPGDESRPADMSLYVKACGQLKFKYNCAIVSIHHTGLVAKERARGSNTLRCALDSEFLCERDDNGILRFSCQKMKEHERPQPLAFKKAVVELPGKENDGKCISSIVLVPIDYTPKPKKGVTGQGKNQQFALQVLDDLMQEESATLFDGRPSVKISGWKSACLTENPDLKFRWTEIYNSLSRNGFIEDVCGHVYRT